MSFIQYKSREEAEAAIDADNFVGFLSEDHRFYKTIEFHDDEAGRVLDVEEMRAVLMLRDYLDMNTNPMHEGNFESLVEAAEELKDVFARTIKALGYESLGSRKAPGGAT